MRSYSIGIVLVLVGGVGLGMLPFGGGHFAQRQAACDGVGSIPGDAVGPGASVARSVARPPAILHHLRGSWEGEGSLFGRPASFAMSWAPELGGRFLGLAYEIRGDVRMSARAHYRVADGSPLRGVWVDSRGEILELEATGTESALTTIWRSDTERGRTVYVRAGAESMEVCDYVEDKDGWRLFGTARYTRN